MISCAEEPKQIIVPVAGYGGNSIRDYAQKKSTMLQNLQTQFPNIKSNALDALDSISMMLFVNDVVRHRCYEDKALPIGSGQALLKPSDMGFILSELDIQPRDSVLEIGTGTGFFAAVLSRLASQVYSIEIIEYLSEIARVRLERLQIENVKLRNANGLEGWERFAPFDNIIITAAIQDWPKPLIEQLRDGGKMVAPILNENGDCSWIVVKKSGDNLETLSSRPAIVAPAITQ